MGYRENVLNRAKKDPMHPINYGFKMQVHHLLSKSGVSKTQKENFLKSYGYDINDSGNLVALPSTLSGACHLKVQLHRGNHGTISLNDNDKVHSKSYHGYIKEILKPAIFEIKNKCKTNDVKKVQVFLNLHSQIVLDDISEFKLPLTKVSKLFQNGGRGCLNENNISGLEKAKFSEKLSCDCDRTHAQYAPFPASGYKLKRGL